MNVIICSIKSRRQLMRICNENTKVLTKFSLPVPNLMMTEAIFSSLYTNYLRNC